MMRRRGASSRELVEDGISRVLDFASVVEEEDVQAIPESEEGSTWKEIEESQVRLFFVFVSCVTIDAHVLERV